MIGDTRLEVAKLFDMIHPNASGTARERTAMDNQTVRSVFVIGGDKKVKAMITYPMSTGRNFDEILRVVDSCQLTAKHKVATTVTWKQGEDVIIVPAVSDEEAKQTFSGRLGIAEALHQDCAATGLILARVEDIDAFRPPFGMCHAELTARYPVRGSIRSQAGGV